MDASEILKSHDLKKTSQRVAFIEMLQSCSAAVSENEAKEKLGKAYDRITFYRTSQTLQDSGVIRRIVVDNTTVKYELAHSKTDNINITNHAHFFCLHCHSLYCLNDINAQDYALPKGFSANQYEVLVKGVCNKCNS